MSTRQLRKLLYPSDEVDRSGGLSPDLAARVHYRRSARARRLILRLLPARQIFEVVVPQSMAHARAVRFAQHHEGWMRARLHLVSGRRPFEAGRSIPVGDQRYEIVLTGAYRGRVEITPDGRRLAVPGDAAHTDRRVREWLRNQARARITPLAHQLAGQVNRRITAISLRDPATRWGSCTASGRLSFSWRLILAPSFVLDYVVAHEVAHLVHLDHSPAFHALNRRLCPRMDEARAWLEAHGNDLLLWGA